MREMPTFATPLGCATPPSWVLHLRTLGAPAGTIEVSRADLLNGSVVIPISINDQLAAVGVPADVEVPASVP